MTILIISNQTFLRLLYYISKPNGFHPDKLFTDKNLVKWAKSKNISMGICTNKQEKLALDLLKKIKLFDFFEYVAGSDTFNFNKPDPRHLTDVVEIIGGDLKKTIMVGDSEVDSMSASNAKIPFVLVEDGYTKKSSKEIPHDILIKDFLNFEKIIEKYL